MSSTVSDRDTVSRKVIASSSVVTSRGTCICNWKESSGKPAVNEVLFELESSSMSRKSQGDKWQRKDILKPKRNPKITSFTGHSQTRTQSCKCLPHFVTNAQRCKVSLAQMYRAVHSLE